MVTRDVLDPETVSEALDFAIREPEQPDTAAVALFTRARELVTVDRQHACE